MNPIMFIKNPFHEDKLEQYSELTNDVEYDYESSMEMGDIVEYKIRVFREDHSMTNPKMVMMAIKSEICNSLFLQVNQLGTVTECTKALKLSREADCKLFMAGHNSCEMDRDIADLFVGFGEFGIEIGVSCINEDKPCNMCDRLKDIDI
ncbi:Enolase [Parasponia andersonii]|uniref:phosphopyruvate hydratase n=1 Tax=Parasponia andersonii TaxID=3476 RepID=A0A2P5AC49_PARAD|nr:Enolase [Parasponia andersonii]